MLNMGLGKKQNLKENGCGSLHMIYKLQKLTNYTDVSTMGTI